jgi:hypothetical protein
VCVIRLTKENYRRDGMPTLGNHEENTAYMKGLKWSGLFCSLECVENITLNYRKKGGKKILVQSKPKQTMVAKKCRRSFYLLSVEIPM